MKIPNHTVAPRVPEKRWRRYTKPFREEKSSLYLDQIL